MSTLLTLVMAAVLSGATVEQQAAAPELLRIAAGPAGAESNGVFVFTEERAKFNRSTDREVIVYFQWQGLPGPHKMVGEWQTPDKTQTSNSIVEYVAKDRRFGAYWRLPISSSMPLGTWSIQATVDGHPAGRFSFDLTDDVIASSPIRRPLSQAELFDRLNRMFVVFHRTNAAGRELDAAAGFTGGRGQVYTAMAAVDDVDNIRAVMSDGSTHAVTGLLAWHRRQQWAVAPALTSGSGDAIAIAPDKATVVGDRCFSMEGGVSGGRSLVEGTITGKTVASESSPPILLAAFLNGIGTAGAPVLNEFGELIGLITGGAPGATRLMDIMQARAQLRGVPIVPLSVVRLKPEAAAVALPELRARGDLLTALSGEQHVLSGGFARSIPKSAVTSPQDQRSDFSVQEKSFTVFLTWSPQDRLRGQTRLRIHDADNRIVADSKPKKTTLRRGDLSLMSWQIPMFATTGVYRAEVLLDEKLVWRGFVRITG